MLEREKRNARKIVALFGQSAWGGVLRYECLRTWILERVCVIGGVYFDMIVQERSKPYKAQLQAKAARSRARGGKKRPNIAEPQGRMANKHG